MGTLPVSLHQGRTATRGKNWQVPESQAGGSLGRHVDLGQHGQGLVHVGLSIHLQARRQAHGAGTWREGPAHGAACLGDMIHSSFVHAGLRGHQ